MDIQKEIIDKLEFDNNEKNKLLMVLFRNTNEYHRRYRNEVLKLYNISECYTINLIVQKIIESDDSVFINYMVASFKDNFSRI